MGGIADSLYYLVGTLIVAAAGMYFYQSRELSRERKERRAREATSSSLSLIAPARRIGAIEIAELDAAIVESAISLEPVTVPPLKAWVERNRKVLERLGISPQGLLEPPAIPTSVFRSLRIALNQPTELLEYLAIGCRSPGITSPTLAYGPNDFWSDRVENAWRKTVSQCVNSSSKTFCESTERFVYSRRAPHIACSAKLVFPYPFFNTPATLQCVGIFPYGVQTVLGLLVPRNLERVCELAQDAHVPEASRHQVFDQQACERGLSSLAQIFQSCVVEDNKFVTRVGYAFDELLLMALQAGPAAKLTQEFDDRIEYIDVGPIESRIEHQRGQAKAIPDEWSAIPKSILLFDPANAPHEIDLKEFKANIYYIPHGLIVPTGVGFSLAMLGDLAVPEFRSNLYKNLIDAGMPPPIPGISWNLDCSSHIGSLLRGGIANARHADDSQLAVH